MRWLRSAMLGIMAVVMNGRLASSLSRSSAGGRSRAGLALLRARGRAQSTGVDGAGAAPEAPKQPQAKPKLLRIARSKASEPKKEGGRGGRVLHEDGNFVTVRLGSEKDVQNAEMEDRLQDAKKWVSKQLSDEEASMLNRAMGIEAEVLAALEEEEDEGDGRGRTSSGSSSGGSSSKQGKKTAKKADRSTSSQFRKMQDDEEARAAAQLRGA